MAKKSLIQKNKLIFKNSKKNFKIIIIKNKLKKKFTFNLLLKIQSIKKKKLKTKFINRCYISGRTRSFYNRFSLNRNLIRKIGNFGYITGIEKSSW
ncbi:ribosomal protein S14 [Candidatus Carsonella ruddii PV]|uniref:Small ribosomal subunit protein uS14 n=2 Tax=Carsonella ruddii TaxID=114186 RepID=RS14_CARRU|nr:30S ribosomal protein S14 [Candidatus Carsonella ruddii]Q9AIF4.1 RecName: Full=Small ribosomal subunit protein uS14; AltName: Full=30S ribosomal protein S14 [Candidatus Carsonella ruddii]AAK17092.1 ribosomal protein S14 [Candidatus Carsonella ruddii]BAF35176.1 ribosomal protein S14 [Candidatus Carsonella ruddii PV]